MTRSVVDTLEPIEREVLGYLVLGERPPADLAELDELPRFVRPRSPHEIAQDVDLAPPMVRSVLKHLCSPAVALAERIGDRIQASTYGADQWRAWARRNQPSLSNP